eukprot:TRINITY_DN7669_c0_g1_i1.p1 TRINITY_DN7669_c0_g1~~TRINITY_DN7669_c0_g1_i1.p1  ORF type:complete len:69 (+),score=4.66 TRINITY_DN7669_c0_g1_i1:33-209(+)
MSHSSFFLTRLAMLDNFSCRNTILHGISGLTLPCHPWAEEECVDFYDVSENIRYFIIR